jgi:uncharacterized protein (DUF488 family)
MLPRRITRPRSETLLVAKLFTVGYEGRTPADLVELLLDAGVARVVDVRELPLSRRRGFSKTPLAETLDAAGIAYEHVRALGNPKETRALYKRGDLQGGREGYRAHLDNGSRVALLALSASLTSSSTCLLCVEEHPDACHRAVIVDALREEHPRLSVTHL